MSTHPTAAITIAGGEITVDAELRPADRGDPADGGAGGLT